MNKAKVLLSALFLSLTFPLFAQEEINFWAAYDFKHKETSVVVAQKRTELVNIPYIGDLGLWTLIGWNFTKSNLMGGGAVIKEFKPVKSNVTFYFGVWGGVEIDGNSRFTGGLIGGVSVLVKD